MGWIPIVGGSLGVAVGGFISDRVTKGRGIYARVAVIIASLVSDISSEPIVALFLKQAVRRCLAILSI